MYIYIYVCVCVCICVYIYIYIIYVYMYIYIYIYIFIYLLYGLGLWPLQWCSDLLRTTSEQGIIQRYYPLADCGVCKLEHIFSPKARTP